MVERTRSSTMASPVACETFWRSGIGSPRLEFVVPQAKAQIMFSVMVGTLFADGLDLLSRSRSSATTCDVGECELASDTGG